MSNDHKRHRGGWRCVRCGYASLVRSNFRFTVDHQAQCRSEKSCGKRAAPPPVKEQPWDPVDWGRGR